MAIDIYAAQFRLGQMVRVDHIDGYGLCGRDPHPNESHTGCIGRIVSSAINTQVTHVAGNGFELANELASTPEDEWLFIHTVLLETPGGDELLEFAEYELTAL